jgi:DNA-binding transcriptional MerR regulator
VKTIRVFDDKPIERIYWTIGEVSAEINQRTSMIRFWVTEFGMELKRARNGDRQFTVEDIEKVKEIHRLLKVERFTIEGAKRKLGL